MSFDVDHQQTVRHLRLRIGRQRRRIDRRVRSLQRQARRLASWRTYVQRYPGYAVLAALGLGLSAGGGLRRGGWTRYVGLHTVRRLVNKVVDLLLDEIRQIWADSAPPDRSTGPDGGDHGRS